MNMIYLARTLWRGLLGIAAEILLITFFILAGFAVCLAWYKAV